MTERNPILQSLFDRKSVRVYEEKPIPAEMKQAILEAAAQAPSAGCQQLYTILDITDPALKEALAESCDHQPFIAKAPLVLVFCADCKKWYDAYLEAGCTPRTPGVGDLMLAVTDAAIAAQNAVVAAESFGIGSCYIGDIMENCDTQRSLLHLPDYVFPAVMLVFGWPTQQQKDRVKPTGIINIVDATNIERNLYLTMQLMELDIPMVLALNMMDEVRGNGGTVRINKMEAMLGIPVIPIGDHVQVFHSGNSFPGAGGKSKDPLPLRDGS